MIFFATAAANVQDLVAQEATLYGAHEVHLTSGGVEFSGDLACAYRFCLHSRIATRLLLGIAQDEEIYDADEFYAASIQIPWETYVQPEKTFAVTITATDVPWLRKSTFGAIRLKDAIVDRVKEHHQQERPTVEFQNPDITFHVHIERDKVGWFIDFSGKGLHKRGYRQGETDAVLKEYLAAAILMRSDWYKTVLDKNPASLLDPFCGSGTIVIEGALIATNTAPGLINPTKYAFLHLDMHDPDVWEEVLEEAYDMHQEGTEKFSKTIVGWDIDPKALQLSQIHAKKAYVQKCTSFAHQDFLSLSKEDIPQGITYIVTDPPYGIRMEQESSIQNFYIKMGKQLNSLFPGWSISVLCGNKELLSYVDMKPNRTNALFNGPLEAQLAHYKVFTEEERQFMIEKSKKKREERLSTPLSPGAEMAFNRLKKNLARLQPLMESEGVSCYRMYDADMPEYSAAIDIYEGKYIHLQEYAPPPSIDEEASSTRLQELIDATERATGIELEMIFIKQRREQKGTSQYEKLNSSGKFYIIREHGLKFFANFSDYLDTGIFLDHRPVRKLIKEQSEGKRFLNLFCYTGTATVHAAAGNALSTVSVDASSTYLDWAIKNMEMNGFTGMNHFYYKTDCIEYLRSTEDMYDLIFCDPPTFSNSKMRRSFDVDRDQQALIHAAMNHLNYDGTLIFSTNFRKFSLHPELLESYSVEDISENTIGEDFARNQKIHYCFLIRHKKAIVRMQKREIIQHKTKKVIKKQTK